MYIIVCLEKSTVVQHKLHVIHVVKDKIWMLIWAEVAQVGRDSALDMSADWDPNELWIKDNAGDVFLNGPSWVDGQ